MQTIYLDISNKGVIPCIQAKQSEVGRKFLAVITDNGVPYNIPLDTLISVWYEGSMDAGNYSSINEKSAFTIDGNKVAVELVAQMLMKPGDGDLCLSLSSANGNEINTWNIPYHVEYKPGAGSHVPTEYYTALTEAAAEAATVLGDARSYAERAEAAAEVAGSSAENAARPAVEAAQNAAAEAAEAREEAEKAKNAAERTAASVGTLSRLYEMDFPTLQGHQVFEVNIGTATPKLFVITCLVTPGIWETLLPDLPSIDPYAPCYVDFVVDYYDLQGSRVATVGDHIFALSYEREEGTNYPVFGAHGGLCFSRIVGYA